MNEEPIGNQTGGRPDESNSTHSAKKLGLSGPGWLLWSLLGLMPVPIGLLMGPATIFDSIQNQSHSKSPGVTYLAIASVCSLFCGIGLAGGFKTRRLINIVTGIVTAIFIVIFVFGIVFFVGCCSAFSHI